MKKIILQTNFRQIFCLRDSKNKSDPFKGGKCVFHFLLPTDSTFPSLVQTIKVPLMDYYQCRLPDSLSPEILFKYSGNIRTGGHRHIDRFIMTATLTQQGKRQGPEISCPSYPGHHYNGDFSIFTE